MTSVKLGLFQTQLRCLSAVFGNSENRILHLSIITSCKMQFSVNALSLASLSLVQLDCLFWILQYEMNDGLKISQLQKQFLGCALDVKFMNFVT